jgi:hypothetical protein
MAVHTAPRLEFCGLQVADEAAGVSYSGNSSTKPWTDVCLAHRKTQRISGVTALPLLLIYLSDVEAVCCAMLQAGWRSQLRDNSHRLCAPGSV